MQTPTRQAGVSPAVVLIAVTITIVVISGGFFLYRHASDQKARNDKVQSKLDDIKGQMKHMKGAQSSAE